MRHNKKVVVAGDGQVTMNDTVLKHSAKKVRRLYQDKVMSGFAGSTADAFTLYERFEGKLKAHTGNLKRSAVDMAKDWRTDKALRKLEALMIVANEEEDFLISGTGDVIAPEDGVIAIGSGGQYAAAAARALVRHSNLSAKQIAEEAMKIAGEICIYTNHNVILDEMDSKQ